MSRRPTAPPRASAPVVSGLPLLGLDIGAPKRKAESNPEAGEDVEVPNSEYGVAKPGERVDTGPQDVITFYDTVTGRKLRWYDPRTEEVHFYEGPKGEERLVKSIYKNGDRYKFEGPEDRERLVESFSGRDGLTSFYEGRYQNERLVRKELPDGRKLYYEGEKGKERLVRMKLPDGRELFYDDDESSESSKSSESGDDDSDDDKSSESSKSSESDNDDDDSDSSSDFDEEEVR